MAKFGYQILGMKSARSDLGALINSLETDSVDLTGSILVGVARHTRPFVPIDTGELINSETIRIRTSAKGRVSGALSYTAPHAAMVHDGGPRNWQRPGASDRFLELGADSFVESELDQVIAKFGIF